MIFLQLKGFFTRVSKNQEEADLNVKNILEKALGDEYKDIDYLKTGVSKSMRLDQAINSEVLQHELWGILHADYKVLTALNIINARQCIKASKDQRLKGFVVSEVDMKEITSHIRRHAESYLKILIRNKLSKDANASSTPAFSNGSTSY